LNYMMMHGLTNFKVSDEILSSFTV